MQYKKLTLSALLLMVPLAASAGSVRSMSGKQLVTGSDGVTYYESNVTCSGKSDPIAIRRPKAGGDWCAADAPDFCDRSKMGAAKDVCGRKYDSYLEDLAAQGGSEKSANAQSTAPAKPPASKPEPASQAAAVAKEQVQEQAPAESLQKQQDELAVEREKLRIEQERLKLKREQIELQKQELEIQRQLKAEAAAKDQAVKKAEAARKAEEARKVQAAKAAEQKARSEEAQQSEEPAPSSGVKKNVLGM
jgi:hypothetical protein